MLSKSRSLLRAGRTRIEIEPPAPGAAANVAHRESDSPMYHLINGRQVAVAREVERSPGAE